MYFGAIDAHAKYLRVGVVDKFAALQVEETVPAEPAQLLAVLAPFRPLRVVVETCPFWPWISDSLRGAGIEFRLAHAKELRAIAHAAQKNDEVDTRLLMRMLHADLIPFAYAKPPEQREEVRLVRHRSFLVRQRTALANRIHAQLHQSGLTLPREELLKKQTRVWLREVAQPQLMPEQRRIVRTHLELIDQLTPRIRDLDRFIERCARKSTSAFLLQTAPGIGPHWSLLLSAEVLPLSRYPTEAKYIGYCGLAPITRASGGKTRRGSLPKGANR